MNRNIASFSWKDLGDAYQAFSALSDEGDWQSLMMQIASVVASNAKRTRRILDYGAGLGSTAASIRRRIYGDHGLFSSWVLYEPDRWAREASAFIMPPLGATMDVAITECVPKTKCDVALFVHTSYYVADFDRELKRVFDDLLSGEEALAICVAMPHNSPFFIDGINNRHFWTSDVIVDSAKKIGLRCDVIPMRSRFRLLADVVEDEKLLRLVASFVCGRVAVSNEEVALVKRKLIGEVDFGDWLVVIRR